MILQLIRGLFVVLCAAVAALYVLPFQQEQNVGFAGVAAMLVGVVAVAGLIVAIDVYTRKKRLSAVSGVFLGLLAGLVAAYALSFPINLIAVLFGPDSAAEMQSFMDLMLGVQVVVGLTTCYLGISMVLQTKDDFRFVIPYVEFSKQIRGTRPTLIDTSVIVDGRIVDILSTRVMQGTLIVPKFVINELQKIADSSDKLRRARGRRGLDILHQLQNDPHGEVVIEEHEAEGAGVDQQLINLAQQLNARLMTNDFNLNKIATLREIEVINLNDLAKALRPVVLPGEQMDVELVKPGESAGQGVGYLEDGTMVVVENGAAHLKRTVSISVTSTLQTSAGRMIFGKYEGPAGGGGSNRQGRSGGSGSGGETSSQAGAETQTAGSPPSPASAAEQSDQQTSPARSTVGRNPRRKR